MCLALAVLLFASCFIQIIPGIPLAVIVFLLSIPSFFADLAKAFYEWWTKDFNLDTIEEENS
jgi:uncharacterized membrane protein